MPCRGSGQDQKNDPYSSNLPGSFDIPSANMISILLKIDLFLLAARRTVYDVEDYVP
jgi:hypothetical protein